jgi:hypothetical protein
VLLGGGGGGGGGEGGGEGGRGHVNDAGKDAVGPAEELAEVVGGVGGEATSDATRGEKEDNLMVEILEL